jgi:hypothetical protein
VVASATLPSTVRLADHGYATNDIVRVIALPGGVLPSGLVDTSDYYAIRLDGDRLQFAAALSGPAVALGTTGTNPWGCYATNDAVALAAIEWCSRLIDQRIPAHVVPFASATLPYLLRGICAKLACRELLARLRRVSAAGPGGVAIVEAQAERAERELDRMISGIPVRDAAATAPANLSVGWGGTERGWGSSSSDGGTIP